MSVVLLTVAPSGAPDSVQGSATRAPSLAWQLGAVTLSASLKGINNPGPMTTPLPTKKSELRARWAMLALLCTGLLGSYYCYDNPSATQVAMEQYYGGNATSTEDDTSSSCSGGSASSSDSGGTFTLYFNLLYSVYSWPNVILPFFGGYLSDKLGVRLMLVVFLLFITLGQVIFAFGASLKGMWAWYVMWIGRTVFGFGGESLSVAQSALIASWFAGKELAFALGLNLALARLGSVVNDVVSIAVANAYSAPYFAFWVGAGVCLLSLGAGLITYYLDQGSEDVLRKNQGKRPAVRTSLLASLLCISACGGGRGGRRGDKEGSLLEEEELSRLVDEKLEEEGLQGEGEWEPEDPPEVIELSAATRFPLTFWLLCVSCVCTYACVLCFNNVAGSFFAQKWLSKDANGKYVPLNQLSAASLKDISSQANNLLLITYLVAAFLAPIFGGLIDWVGYRAVLTAFSSGLITGVHCLLAFVPRDSLRPEGPLVLLGLCYSIYASALWPSVALVTEKKSHGTAYGIVTAVQNLGLAAIPLGIGVLQPSSCCATYDECVAGYTHVEILLVLFGVLGFVASVALNVVDYRSPISVLNWSAARTSLAQRDTEEKQGLLVNSPADKE